MRSSGGVNYDNNLFVLCQSVVHMLMFSASSMAVVAAFSDGLLAMFGNFSVGRGPGCDYFSRRISLATFVIRIWTHIAWEEWSRGEEVQNEWEKQIEYQEKTQFSVKRVKSMTTTIAVAMHTNRISHMCIAANKHCFSRFKLHVKYTATPRMLHGWRA